jgi:Tol biopolymer transport system component
VVSPDGRSIAFSDWDACEGGTSQPRLSVVDPVGRPTGELAKLRHNGSYPNPEHSNPAWSPDGAHLAYLDCSELYVVNRDGTGGRHLARVGDACRYNRPAWSPDGRWIAFVRRSDSAPGSIFVVHRDGTGLRRVAQPARANNDDTPSGLAWLPALPNKRR